jgi:DNA-binding MarR family transcriptional regulator
MADDGAAARHRLLDRVRDVLKAVRLVKGRQPPGPTVIPSGTVGVLATIDKIESGVGCHGKDLAAECALDPSTISRAVGALVRSGLVVRTADPADGRASVLAMTPQGRQALDDIVGWYNDLLAEALGAWSVRDLTRLTDLLQRFSDDLIARFDARHAAPLDGPNPAGNPHNTDPHNTGNPHNTLEAAR